MGKAQATTQKRVEATGCPRGILSGTISNTTSTEAIWKEAVNVSETVVKEENWQDQISIILKGWATTHKNGTYSTKSLNDVNLSVGGKVGKLGGKIIIDHVGN